MDTEHSLTMVDGVSIPYRLDGCSEPNAPLIVLSNPSLVDWSIWDEFISTFSAVPQNKKYRFLRYEARGRSNNGGANPLTLDTLTDDVIVLLDTLKVPKAAAMTGISLGGMTVLNLAYKYPERVATILSCDLFPVSPPGNRAAWNRRVAIAQEDQNAPKGVDGTRLIGQDLAEVTVRRWLSPKSFDGGVRESRAKMLQKLVYYNRLDGLISIAQVLSSYDLQKDAKNATVPGLFIAGEDDDPVLIQGMRELATNYGNGTELYIIQEAGHLTVVEQPEEFASIMTNFLEANSSNMRGS